nr:unnamed protein product [Digitaria exilis]
MSTMRLAALVTNGCADLRAARPLVLASVLGTGAQVLQLLQQRVVRRVTGGRLHHGLTPALEYPSGLRVLAALCRRTCSRHVLDGSHADTLPLNFL